MINKELRVSADTVLDIDTAEVEERIFKDETQFICEGDYDHLKLMKLLKDKRLSPTARNVIKQQNYLYLYGGNTRRSVYRICR